MPSSKTRAGGSSKGLTMIDQRWRGRGLEIVGEIADAAGQQNADVGLAQIAGRADGVVDPLPQILIAERNVEREISGRRAQAAAVLLVEERHPVVGPQRLVDAFAEQEPVIVDGNDRLIRRRDDPVDVDRSLHRLPPTLLAVPASAATAPSSA